ncbi:hypothetical protein OROHE_006156 [Orobanche hederae]
MRLVRMTLMKNLMRAMKRHSHPIKSRSRARNKPLILPSKFSCNTKGLNGKKDSGHVATPHPAKQAGKTPHIKQTAQFGGSSVTCKSCSRAFGSEKALESHSTGK